MQKIILYTIVIVFSFLSKVVAQENRKEKIEERKEKIEKRKEKIENRKAIIHYKSNKTESFEHKAKGIASNIEMITTEEKNALKKEVEAIDLQVNDGKITSEKAQELKQKIAEERANNIETKLAIEEAKLTQLIQDKVEGKYSEKTKKDSIEINGKF